MISDAVRCRRNGAILVAAAITSACPALAQTGTLPGAPETRAQQPLEPPQEAPSDGSLWQRDRLLGDPGGIRSRIEDAGFTITVQETSEVLGNVTGDTTGAVYEGSTLAALQIDTAKAIGLPGGTFRASMYQIHGQGLSANNLGNLNTVSNIEASPGSRLFDLWYEQSLLGGAVSLRLGEAPERAGPRVVPAVVHVSSQHELPAVADVVLEQLRAPVVDRTVVDPVARARVERSRERAVRLAVAHPAELGVDA